MDDGLIWFQPCIFPKTCTIGTRHVFFLYHGAGDCLVLVRSVRPIIMPLDRAISSDDSGIELGDDFGIGLK
jgi:hypothetical protein